MTDVVPAAQAGEIEKPQVVNTRPEGLEDFDQSDMVMPRLTIDGKKAKFVDSLSGEEFDKMESILLGLIKQRVLWPPEPSENGKDKPLCRSFEFKIGHPDVDRFPWKEAEFKKDAFVKGDSEAAVHLPCEDCHLKEWDSHPKRDAPWCSEQHTFAILIPIGDENEQEWAPAIFTVQRSGLKASKAYLTSFARSRKPLYVCTTKLALDARKRGQVDYAVPKFAKGADTDQSMWSWFAEQFRIIRDFVQTPREEEVVDDDDDSTTTAAPAGVSTEKDEDLPF